jgi:methylene-fatty-acyl-phospholipid synthase
VNPALWLGSAVLLSLERICYVWIARAPARFRSVCGRTPGLRNLEPVEAVGAVFIVFKAIQASVFIVWCYAYGEGVLWPPAAPLLVAAPGALLIAGGQALSASVFYRLGRAGVFYGDRFGRNLPWCRQFPFSVLAHPQYVGALLTIWGIFLLVRFPHDDWFLLPALETAYYALGARLEDSGRPTPPSPVTAS